MLSCIHRSVRFREGMFCSAAPLDQKQRKIVLWLAISTFFVLSLPALVTYIIFKAQSLKKCSLDIQKISQKTSRASLNHFDSKTHRESEGLAVPKEDLLLFQELQDVIKQIRTELSLLDHQHRQAIEVVLDQLSRPGILNEEPLSGDQSKAHVLALRQKLKLAIQKVGIQRELRKKGKVVSSLDFEIPLLKALGYPLTDESPYYNKEFLYQIVSQIVNAELENTDCISLSEISNFFTKIGLKVRLQQLQLTDVKKIELFESILSLCQGYREDMLSKCLELTLPTDIPADKFPMRVKKMQEDFRIYQKEILDQFLALYLAQSPIKSCFLNHKGQEVKDLFSQEMRKLTPHVNSFWKEKKSVYGKYFDFMKNWHSSLAFEIVQGAHPPDEILHAGICYAMNLDFLKKVLNGEKPSFTDFLNPEVGKKLRFSQARYQVSLKDDPHVHPGFEKPEFIFSTLRTSEFKQEMQQALKKIPVEQTGWMLLHFFFGKEDFIKTMSQESQNEFLQKYKGKFEEVLEQEIEAEGHAVSVYIHPSENRYGLFDPNLGHFSISPPNGESLFLDFLYQMIDLFYPELLIIRGYKMRLKTQN